MIDCSPIDGPGRGRVRRYPREDCVMRERVSLVSELTGAPFYRLARACQQGTSLGIDARASRWAMREMR